MFNQIVLALVTVLFLLSPALATPGMIGKATPYKIYEFELVPPAEAPKGSEI